MTFGPDHYVPVLKVKRAEKHALGALVPAIRTRITPLLEIVERKKSKALDAHLDTAFKDLAASVQPYARCLLDTREIAPDGPPGATAVFKRAKAAGITFTPVTGVSRSADVEAALNYRTNGIALRLSRNELEAGGLAGRIRRFMTAHELAPEDTDLIMDLGASDVLIADGIVALTAAFLDEIPAPTRWRTLTVSASAFPSSMGVVNRNSHHLVERAAWIAWRDGLHARRNELQRLSTFSDCAIQHPAGVEGFDPRTMQSSATIRYTRPDAWLLIKGEGTRATPPSVQFPRLATQLVYGHLRSHFDGPHHCAGCRSMKQAADGAPGLGSLEAWRRLGTIHHITTVMADLVSLPEL